MIKKILALALCLVAFGAFAGNTKTKANTEITTTTTYDIDYGYTDVFIAVQPTVGTADVCVYLIAAAEDQTNALCVPWSGGTLSPGALTANNGQRFGGVRRVKITISSGGSSKVNIEEVSY